jgi:predicted Zn-dependent protease
VTDKSSSQEPNSKTFTPLTLMPREFICTFFLLLVLFTAPAASVAQTGIENTKLSGVAGKSTTKVYFVPLGDIPSLSLERLMTFYNQKFGLAIKTLPGLPLERSSVDWQRRQLVAEELIEFMKRGYPRLANDPRIILIGISEFDMYIRKYTWQFSFSYRAQNRFAVVSSARLNPVSFGQPADQALLHTRLRKVITKNIGILYFHLPQNNNPRSVLYRSILGIDDLDRVGEDF